MAPRTSTTTVTVVGIALVAALALAVAPAGQPVSVAGIRFDAALAVSDRGELPSGIPVEVGDRVAAARGQQVDTLPSLFSLAGAAQTLRVRIRQQSERAIEVVGRDEIGAIEDRVRSGELSVVAVDDREFGALTGEEGGDALRAAFAERVDPVIQVEVLEPGKELAGDLPIRRDGPSPWPVCAVLFGLGATIMSRRRDPGGFSATRAAATLIAGAGVGLIAHDLTNTAGIGTVAGRVAAWGAAAALLFLPAVDGVRVRTSLERWSWLGFVGVTVALTCWALAADLGATFVSRFGVVAAAVVVFVPLLRAVSGLVQTRATASWAPASLTVIAAVIAGGAAWGSGAVSLAATAPYVVAVGSLVHWGVTVAHGLGLVPHGVMERSVAGESEHADLHTWFRRVRALVEPHRLDLFIILAGRAVRVGAAAGVDGRETLRAHLADPERGSFVEMLALEGGMYPRHERWSGSERVEEDPFDGIAARLGVVAALPIAREQFDAVSAFAVISSERDDEDATERSDGSLAGGDASDAPSVLVGPELEQVAEVCGRLSDAALGRLAGVAASELLAAIERRVRTASAGTTTERAGPGRERSTDTGDQDASGEVEERTGGTERGSASRREDLRDVAGNDSETELDASLARQRAAHLAEQIAIRYPIDDPDALDASEREALDHLVATNAPSLIIGEPGVGKQFMARAIHAQAGGTAESFFVVDAATLPASVVPIVLFGDDSVPGVVDLVAEGTLLIASASRLGDAVREEVLTRLGALRARLIFSERYAGEEQSVPAHIPAGIRSMVGDRSLHLAPLRERPDDIERFAAFFLHRDAMRYDRIVTSISDEATALLRSLELPGNFRDLRALIAAAVLAAESEELGVEDLEMSWAVAEEADTGGPQTSLDELQERESIREALERADGNKSEAARSLGMSRGKFLRRLKRYGVGQG